MAQKLKVILPQPKDEYRVRTMSPLRYEESTSNHMLLLKLKTVRLSLSTGTRVSGNMPIRRNEI